MGWVGFSSLWEQQSDASLGLSSAATTTRCSKCIPYALKMPTERKIFLLNQNIVLLFNILSALGMNGVAFFDMGNYPMTHMMVVIETIIDY